jgi:hypothetical protein
MSRGTTLRRVYFETKWLYGGRARLSSLVCVSSNASLSPAFTFQTPSSYLSPLNYYGERLALQEYAPSPQEIVWRVPPQPLPRVPESRSEPLRTPPTQWHNQTSQENPTPPKPEKPKWEEEEYANIGKSTPLPIPFNISNRHHNKSPSLHFHPTPPQIHSLPQSRTSSLPNHTSQHPSTASRKICL